MVPAPATVETAADATCEEVALINQKKKEKKNRSRPHTLLCLSHCATGTPGSTWVKGVRHQGAYKQRHYPGCPPFQASQYSDIAVTVNGAEGRPGPCDTEGPAERGQAGQGGEVGEQGGRSTYYPSLVRSAPAGVHEKGWTQAHPRLSLDVLDWDNLDSPHGIIGQIFPNRASPRVFSDPSPNTLSTTASNTVSECCV